MRYGHYFENNDIYNNNIPFDVNSKENKNHIQLFDYIWDELHDKHGVVFTPYNRANSDMLVKFINGSIEKVPTRYLHPRQDIHQPNLKPCPICGGYPLIEKNHGYRVFCTTCGLASAKLPLLYWAIHMWENRGDISCIYHAKEKMDYRSSQHLDPQSKQSSGGYIKIPEEDIRNMTSSQYCWVDTHTLNPTGVSSKSDGKPVDFGEHTDLYEALRLCGYGIPAGTGKQLITQYNLHSKDFVEDMTYYMLDPYRWCKDNPKMQDILTI